MIDPIVEESAANTWARLSETEQTAIGAWLKEHDTPPKPTPHAT